MRPLQCPECTATALAAAAVTMLVAFSLRPCQAPRTPPPATPMPATIATKQMVSTCQRRDGEPFPQELISPSVDVDVDQVEGALGGAAVAHHVAQLQPGDGGGAVEIGR